MARARASSTSAPESTASTASTASRVRTAVTRTGARGRAWRISDFSDMPALAVAQALSRLAREGVIVRLSKGVYAVKGDAPGRVRVYDARRRGSARAQRKPRSRREPAPVFPAGILAFNELQLSFQNTARPTMSTPGARAPKELVDHGFRVITRRPAAWRSLERLDGAILEVLRDGALHSQMEARDTAKVIARSLLEPGRLERVLAAAPHEPPRVRAMLGAVLEHDRGARDKLPPGCIEALRATLNPVSRYDLGEFVELPTASRWYARARRPYF